MIKETEKYIIALTIVFGLSCLTAQLVQAQESVNYSKDQLVVKFNSEVRLDLKNCTATTRFGHTYLDSIFATNTLKSIHKIGNIKELLSSSFLLKFDRPIDVEGLSKRLLTTSLFKYIEPNYRGRAGGVSATSPFEPNDTNFERQHAFFNDGSFSLSPSTEDADIDMDLAWRIEKGDESIIVAILDTGVKMDHPEFEGRIWTNEQEMIDGADSDSNGYRDDVRGWDFVNNDNDPSDDSGHGTNVAGILAANGNNNLGYAGVDWNCQLMICKIVDEEKQGLYTMWASAIYYAVDHGADIINMSVGGIPTSKVLEEAVAYAYDNGVVIVASMMNDNKATLYYPAAYETTIAVGSTNPNDERSISFLDDASMGSNFGDHIDVVAPGNFIYGLDYQSDSNFNTFWGGTSQAAPLVSGLGALLLAQDPSRTPNDIRELIREYAEDQIGDSTEDVKGFDMYYGYGRINAHHTLDPTVVGIEEEGAISNFDFLVYPNPANDYINIELNYKVRLVRLLDRSGKIVLEKTINFGDRTLILELEGIGKGLYLVELLDSLNHHIISKKVIIR
jgi:thermitase